MDSFKQGLCSHLNVKLSLEALVCFGRYFGKFVEPFGGGVSVKDVFHQGAGPEVLLPGSVFSVFLL